MKTGLLALKHSEVQLVDVIITASTLACKAKVVTGAPHFGVLSVKTV